MATTLKVTIIGAVFALMLTLMVQPPPAQADINYGAGCAEMLNNPTDGNCEFYKLSRWRYFHWSNDRYASLYRYHKHHNHLRKAHIELQAARYTCRGTLFEDFSCSGPKH